MFCSTSAAPNQVNLTTRFTSGSTLGNLSSHLHLEHQPLAQTSDITATINQPQLDTSSGTTQSTGAGAAAGAVGGKSILNRLQGVLAESLNPSTSQSSAINSVMVRAPIDRKILERIYRSSDKIIRQCQNPRINLKNSPPYILDTLPDICAYLLEIVRRAEDFEKLAEIDYFKIFVLTLSKKCKNTLKLFKESKDRMFIENSTCRQRLTKYSLVFSHLLKDLQALFPSHTYTESFTITKEDARAWWATQFPGRTIVSWEQFSKALLKTTAGVEDANQMAALQSTIDLTCNDHVSIFEFDVFVRLFQPWNNILETWKALAVVHPGYMAFMTYDEVKAVLNRLIHERGPCSYVYRLSCTKLGQWAIGYVTVHRQILQTIIQNKSLAQALLDGEREGYYKYPNGLIDQSPDLYSLVHNLPEVRIQVTQEQYQLYWEIGTTFEVCKICTENSKDIRLEPCRHLLCKPCLLNWQSNNGQHCPFCRREIKSTEEVVVDPFSPRTVAAAACSSDGQSSSTTNIDLIDLRDSGVRSADASHPSGSIQHDAFQNLSVAPPRPPRMVPSPANSPAGARRATVPGAYSTIDSSQSGQSTHQNVRASSSNPPTASARSTWVAVPDSTRGNLNYVQLDFDRSDGDEDFEDLPFAPPPPIPCTTSSGIVPSSSDESAGSSSASRHGASGDGPASIETHVRTLVQEGVTERVARRLLTITQNNLLMSREILVYFVPKQQ